MSKLKNRQNMNYLHLNVKEDAALGVQGTLKKMFLKQALVDKLIWSSKII